MSVPEVPAPNVRVLPSTVGDPNSTAVPPLLTKSVCPALPNDNEAPVPPVDKPIVSPD